MSENAEAPPKGLPISLDRLERLRHDALRQGVYDEVRAQIAGYLGTTYSRGTLNEAERRIAIELFEILAQDVAVTVRKALAEHVKSCAFLPRELARRLAEDVETVSLPVLKYSSALSDEDLLAILASAGEEKQVAIAERETVSEKVGDTLAETGSGKVVRKLLANPKAQVSEKALNHTVTRFSTDEGIQRLLIDRPKLPLSVVEGLITHISVDLKERLVSKHDLPQELAEELVMQARELSLSDILAKDSRKPEVARLANTLHSQGKLTPTLIMRSLLVGDLFFFEAAIATMARVPPMTARRMLFRQGMDELHEIYKKSGLPEPLFRAVVAAIQVVKEMRRANKPHTQRQFTQQIISRIVMHYRDLCPSELEHVLSQVSWRILGRRFRQQKSAGTAAPGAGRQPPTKGSAAPKVKIAVR